MFVPADAEYLNESVVSKSAPGLSTAIIISIVLLSFVLGKSIGSSRHAAGGPPTGVYIQLQYSTVSLLRSKKSVECHTAELERLAY